MIHKRRGTENTTKKLERRSEIALRTNLDSRKVKRILNFDLVGWGGGIDKSSINKPITNDEGLRENRGWHPKRSGVSPSCLYKQYTHWSFKKLNEEFH